MATTVGKENLVRDTIRNPIALEHDAIAAADQAIDRLDGPSFKEKIAAFKGDRERLLTELESVAERVGAERPRSGDTKERLTEGKIALADRIGDGAILKAMKTNEDDTVTAYERASQHQEVTDEIRPIFQRALEDERRLRAWMDGTSSRLSRRFAQTRVEPETSSRRKRSRFRQTRAPA